MGTTEFWVILGSYTLFFLAALWSLHERMTEEEKDNLSYYTLLLEQINQLKDMDETYDNDANILHEVEMAFKEYMRDSYLDDKDSDEAMKAAQECWNYFYSYYLQPKHVES